MRERGRGRVRGPSRRSPFGARRGSERASSYRRRSGPGARRSRRRRQRKTLREAPRHHRTGARRRRSSKGRRRGRDKARRNHQWLAAVRPVKGGFGHTQRVRTSLTVDTRGRAEQSRIQSSDLAMWRARPRRALSRAAAPPAHFGLPRPASTSIACRSACRGLRSALRARGRLARAARPAWRSSRRLEGHLSPARAAPAMDSPLQPHSTLSRSRSSTGAGRPGSPSAGVRGRWREPRTAWLVPAPSRAELCADLRCD